VAVKDPAVKPPPDSIIFGDRRSEELLRRIVEIGGSLLGLSAVTSLVGWLWIRAYYQIHGAPWLAFEAPATYVLDASIFATLSVLGGIYSAVLSCGRRWPRPRLDVPIFLATTAALLLMVAWQLPATSVAGFTRLIEVGGGAILGSIVVMCRRSQESKPDSAHRLLRPTLGYAFLLGALIVLPLSSGAIHAWKECSLGNMSLPRVSLKGDTRKWVLLLQ
jgi:hypothetical protein